MIQLSIIIPVYNAERYIRRCIHSIIAGHSLENIEIICVDDGSKDKSGEICEDFSKKYQNIYVIHQTNQGVASARNTGLSMAKGEYIAWVDSDDYVETRWLIDILSIIRNKHPGMILLDYYEEDISGKKNKVLPFKEGDINQSDVIYELSRDTILRSYLWRYVIHRSFFKDYHFDIKDIVEEDYRCLTYLVPKIHIIYYLKHSLYNYIQNDNSLTHSDKNIKKSFNSIMNAKERYEYFTQLGFKASKVAYYRTLIGNCGFLLYANAEDWQAIKSYQYIKKEFFNMMRSDELEKLMKLKLLMLLLPSKVYRYFYHKRHNLV